MTVSSSVLSIGWSPWSTDYKVQKNRKPPVSGLIFVDHPCYYETGCLSQATYVAFQLSHPYALLQGCKRHLTVVSLKRIGDRLPIYAPATSTTTSFNVAASCPPLLLHACLRFAQGRLEAPILMTTMSTFLLIRLLISPLQTL